MKSCAVIFTYPNDYIKTCYLCSTIKDCVDDVYFCIETKHKDVPIPSWAKQLIVDFDRCGSLHGCESIIGQKAVYKKLALEMDYDLVLKIDADTAVFKPDCFIKAIEIGSDFAFIRRGREEVHGINACNGCCYAMSKAAIKELEKANSSEFDSLMLQLDRHEDLVFSLFFANKNSLYRHEINKNKVWLAARPYRESDIIAGHYGYVDLERLQDEIKMLGDDFFNKIYTNENKEYEKLVRAYCEKNNIRCGIHRTLYELDGKPTPEFQKQLDAQNRKKAEMQKMKEQQAAQQANIQKKVLNS